MNNKYNIFLLNIEGEENHFTACLQYLLDSTPEIGQKFIDSLFKPYNLKGPKFIDIIDQPRLYSAKSSKQTINPDLLIKCDGANIIIENKINARLGHLQLEKYLEAAQEQTEKTYLTCISQRDQIISNKIIKSDSYLHPIGRNYFAWKDFYSVFSSSQNRLAKDFLGLMRYHNMQPPENVEGWEDLFLNSTSKTVQIFRQQWEKTREFFRGKGAKCSLDGEDKYAFRINYPTEWLHLIYLHAYEWEGEAYLSAFIWMHENSPYLDAFTDIEDEKELTTEEIKISAIGGTPGTGKWLLKDGSRPKCVAEYWTKLFPLLSTGLTHSR